MAEFCLDCFNHMNGTHYQEKNVTLEDDFCEGCAAWKPCVMLTQPPSLFSRIAKIIQASKGNKESKQRIIIRRNGNVKVTKHGQLISIETCHLIYRPHISMCLVQLVLHSMN